jgi:nitronate monooxygenase
MGVLDDLAVPIVQAPLAGGPSTPELAAAVSAAGGFGFLAAGYLTPERLGDDITRLRTMTTAPFGVNVFVGGAAPADPDVVAGYARALEDEARRVGVALGRARFDDDAFDAKVGLLCGDPVAVVSFTFGLPPADAVRRLTAVGSEVWITVTSPEEAGAAAALGADALVVQGVEAGGHRGVFVDDDGASDLTLLAALQLIGAGVDVPLVAAGGLVTGGAIAAVLAAGASAAQLGTAYLRCPEAATSDVQRRAVDSSTTTVLTRAFTGRVARGVGNRFHAEHGAEAPRAYPEVHHLTAPLRAHGRSHGDADLVNLWAGQTHQLGSELPAAELTRRLAADARDAIAVASRRLASVPIVE